jgi:hypothetical protein
MNLCKNWFYSHGTSCENKMCVNGDEDNTEPAEKE